MVDILDDEWTDDVNAPGLKKVSDLEVGEGGFTLPQSLKVNNDLEIILNGNVKVAEEADQIKCDWCYLFKTPEGLHFRINPQCKYRWKLEACFKNYWNYEVTSIEGQFGAMMPFEYIEPEKEDKCDCHCHKQCGCQNKVPEVEEPSQDEKCPVHGGFGCTCGYDKQPLLLENKKLDMPPGLEKPDEKTKIEVIEDVKGKKLLDLGDNEHGYIKASQAFVDENLNIYVDCETTCVELPTDDRKLLVQKTALGYSMALDSNHLYKVTNIEDIGLPLLVMDEVIGLDEPKLPVAMLDLGDNSVTQSVEKSIEGIVDPGLLYYYKDLEDFEDIDFGEKDEDDLMLEEMMNNFEGNREGEQALSLD